MIQANDVSCQYYHDGKCSHTLGKGLCNSENPREGTDCEPNRKLTSVIIVYAMQARANPDEIRRAVNSLGIIDSATRR